MGEKKINTNTKQCPTFLRLVVVSSPLNNNDNDTVMTIMIFFPQRLNLKFKYQILSITGQMRIHCLHIIVTRRAYGLFLFSFLILSLLFTARHTTNNVCSQPNTQELLLFFSPRSLFVVSLFKICSCFSCLF